MEAEVRQETETEICLDCYSMACYLHTKKENWDKLFYLDIIKFILEKIIFVH